MNTVTVLCFLCVMILGAQSHRLCKTDTECADLGKELICVKDVCNWGSCGCPRGKAVRFEGSERNFKCVPLKKIGESCNYNSDVGICGPANSYCNEESSRCECRSGHISIWYGERCVPARWDAPVDYTIRAQPDAYVDWVWPLETYSINLGNKCNVNNGGYSLLVGAVASGCNCGRGARVVLTNAFAANPEYLGKKVPICVPNQIGIKEHLCISDLDCPGARSICKNNYCQCRESDEVPNYERNACAKPFNGGEQCDYILGEKITGDPWKPEGRVCDGSKGLICGGVCNAENEKLNRTLIKKTCVCGPAYSGTTTCTENGIGSTCFGDGNCRNNKIGYNGICVEGKCQNHARTLVASIVVLIIALAAQWL